MGGGGGGGGSYYPDNWTPQQSERSIRHAERESFEAGFRTELSTFLGELLLQFNARDTDALNDKLDALSDFFADDLETAILQKFGGSVAKHTYVDGLSDIDALFVLKSKDLDYDQPNQLVEHFANLAKTKLGNNVDVEHGEMAVTLTYPDGTIVDVLPATTTEAGNLKISSPNGDKWSSIKPEKFQTALSKVNADCNGKLVPTIKLAKAVISTLPESQRLTGYHVESMAVDAFRNYTGTKSNHEMLVNFFNSAKSQVLAPKVDKTGQSRHVDDYLGAANSRERLRSHYVLDRLEKRMRNANSAGSLESWKTIFGLDE